MDSFVFKWPFSAAAFSSKTLKIHFFKWNEKRHWEEVQFSDSRVKVELLGEKSRFKWRLQFTVYSFPWWSSSNVKQFSFIFLLISVISAGNAVERSDCTSSSIGFLLEENIEARAEVFNLQLWRKFIFCLICWSNSSVNKYWLTNFFVAELLRLFL
jgi:hypothetical protein